MKTLNAGFLGVATSLLLLFAAPPLQAATVTYNLAATAGTVAMPDGASVPVWGLVQGANLPLTPVPVLTAAAGDDLLLNLTNNLPEPVCLTINGQQTANPAGFAVQAPTPVFFADANGRNRGRSFTYETAAGGGTASYAWTNLNPGTYLIGSGSHPSVQVPMGLYAVLKVDVAPNEAYPGELFDSEATLLFSELDPVLNQAVAAGAYGTATYPTALKVGYKPKYFLLNGRPWSASSPPLASVTAGETVLLRLLNAGLRARAPIFPGQALTMLAEDGKPAGFQPIQVTADLFAGKTLDAVFTAPANAGYLPLHDRALGLSGGGMLGYLTVGTPTVALDVTVTGPGSVSTTSLPGGIAACAAGDCSASYLADTAVALHALPSGPDSALSSWSVNLTAGGTPTGECIGGGDCVVTLDQGKTVTAIFANYAATTLISPNGGEQVPLDQTMPIRWAAPADVYTFDLGYSPSPGSPFRMFANRVAGREFLWDLATANLRPSSAVRLAIVGYDASGAIVDRDTSDTPFALVSPLQLTYPNGATGEAAIVAGDPVTITWDVRPTVIPVVRGTLWFQASTNTPWTLVADVDPILGSYAWTAPATPTAGATARMALTLYDATGKVVANDTSDAPFSIVPPAGPLAATSRRTLTATTTVAAAVAEPADLVLLIPNGGEILAGEIPFTILWQDTTQAATFVLDYSLDGGQNWQSLATAIEGNQFDWIIATELRGSNAVRLRITAVDAKDAVLARDLSDAAFAID